MTDSDLATHDTGGFSAGSAGTVFLVSFSLIALQLFHMRALSVLRYHHFSYLVISTALLGFGASGTFLSFTFLWFEKRPESRINGLLFLFCLSIPVTTIGGGLLPIDIQYLFYSAGQVALLLLTILFMFIPFFLGATVIGFSLKHFHEDLPRVYGTNLFGSGLGGIAAVGLMHLVPAELLPTTSVVPAMAAWILWPRYRCRPSANTPPSGSKKSLISPYILAVMSITLISTAPFFMHFEPGTDYYKALAHLLRLERQGDAERILTAYSPRMRLDVFDAPSFHQTLFAGPITGTKGPAKSALSPAQFALLFDGEIGGTVFRISSEDEAGILDSTPQSLPYRIFREKNRTAAAHREHRVLLLGETGGSNIWLARRMEFSHITLVQPSQLLLRVLREDLDGEIGGVFNHPELDLRGKNCRLYIEGNSEKYDLIQIVTTEGNPAGTGGLQALHEDHLLTTEGIATCLETLETGGFVAFTRGIQTPPRDNIRIFGLCVSALRKRGVSDPSRHILQARNYLAVTTLVSATPLEAETIVIFQEECTRLGMDMEYHPGIQFRKAPYINKIDGPAGKPYSWYRHSALLLLTEPERLYEDWVYNVKPPTDESPYFHNFFRWKSLPNFLETYDIAFIRQMELGYMILVLCLLLIIPIAILLILLPLVLGKSGHSREHHGDSDLRRKLTVLLYFGAIGLGFMFIEMVLIQKLGNFLGDPIYSVSAVITSILFCAGIGSSLQGHINLPPEQRIFGASVAVISLIAVLVLFLDSLFDLLITVTLLARFIAAFLVIAPAAFFMGWMLPSGMEILSREQAELIPWAWGINGFASVTAGPLAVLLSMETAYSTVLWAAAGCYLLAGGLHSSRIWYSRRCK